MPILFNDISLATIKLSKDILMVGTIDLRTVMNGAGPILMCLNELISSGKRLIVADSTSITDIEQIALAMTKSNKKVNS